MSRRLKDTIPNHVVVLFKRKGATVDTSANTITATQKQTRHSVDRRTQKILVKRSNLTVSG